MSCKYEYYRDEENYFPRLYCSIDNNYCLYAKKCLKVNKFIPLENQKECYKMIQEKQKNIPSGSYYVQSYRPNQKGELYLYVVINEKVVKISTKFTEINQEYVYLKERASGFEVSLSPFQERKTYKKTKS